MLRAISTAVSALLEQTPMTPEQLHDICRRMLPPDAWVQVDSSVATSPRRSGAIERLNSVNIIVVVGDDRIRASGETCEAALIRFRAEMLARAVTPTVERPLCLDMTALLMMQR